MFVISIIVYEFYQHNTILFFPAKSKFVYPNNRFVALEA